MLYFVWGVLKHDPVNIYGTPCGTKKISHTPKFLCIRYEFVHHDQINYENHEKTVSFVYISIQNRFWALETANKRVGEKYRGPGEEQEARSQEQVCNIGDEILRDLIFSYLL